VNNYIGIREQTDAFKDLVGCIINRSMESGVMEKKDIIIILEDIIQHVERGSLKTILEYT
jgi:hypothetical protein